jgi:hypothetical protein
MNKLAASRFLAAGLCMWGAALWVQGGFRALREDKDREREIWHKAEVDSRPERDPHSTTDVQAELANEVKATAQGFGFNGVSER